MSFTKNPVSFAILSRLKTFYTSGIQQICNHHYHHVSNIKTANTSTLQQAYLDSNVQQALSQKQLRNQQDTITRADVDAHSQRIRNKLDKALSQNSSDKIIQCLLEYQKHCDSHQFDCSVYGKAIKNCAILNDYRTAKKVMDMMLAQISGKNVFPKNLNNVVFAIFFNVMAKTDQPLIAYEYFRIMINELHIIPNVISFSTLIKTCRRQSKYLLAEEYWKLMENTYHIVPNALVYTEMLCVYSNANQPAKAVGIFKQYISTLTDDEKERDEMMPLFGAHLNIFSRVGDADGMMKAMKLIQRYKHKINIVMYGDVMRGCIVARKPYKAIKIYKRLTHEGIKPLPTTLDLKGIALSAIIRSGENLHFEDKLKVYNKLIKHNNKEYDKYGYKSSGIAWNSALTTAVALYHNVNPMEIVRIFEDQLHSHTNIIQYKANESLCRSDLHCFPHLTVQFLLRYIIGFKLKEFKMGGNMALEIIVGKGKHNNKAGFGMDTKYSIKEFVKDELLTFVPSIECVEHSSNSGILCVSKEQLRPYLQNDNNYATDKLTQPSNDWYLYDRRNII